jgi:hypothetical protein
MISFNKLVGLIDFFGSVDTLLTERFVSVNDKEAFLSSYFSFKKLAVFSLAKLFKIVALQLGNGCKALSHQHTNLEN